MYTRETEVGQWETAALFAAKAAPTVIQSIPIIGGLFKSGVREAHEKEVQQKKAQLVRQLKSNPANAIAFLTKFMNNPSPIGCPGESVPARVCWATACQLAEDAGWRPARGEIKPYEGRPWEHRKCRDGYDVQWGQAAASIKRWLRTNLSRLQAGLAPVATPKPVKGAPVPPTTTPLPTAPVPPSTAPPLTPFLPAPGYVPSIPTAPVTEAPQLAGFPAWLLIGAIPLLFLMGGKPKERRRRRKRR